MSYPNPGQQGQYPPGQGVPVYGPPGQDGHGYGPPGHGPPGQGAPGYPPGGYGFPQQGGYPPAGYPPAGGPPQYMGGQYPPGPPGPVVAQPMGQPNGGWMNMPQAPANCPPGLEYLTMIDQLLVHQKVELLEAFTGFETKNKYSVKNSLGQKVYYAVEDSDCCTRNCCGPLRPFDMKIFDNFNNEVIHLYRPLACDSCCFPCCLQSIEVSGPPGTVIGTVQQEWSICCPSYAIKDSAGETVLRIEGPFCTWSFCGDVEFRVTSADGGTNLGKISKQWSGLAREAFTDADNFGITFPIDLDVRIKATLLGACFLIDFMFFEKQANRESDGVGML